jgi:hypothetical protein
MFRGGSGDRKSVQPMAARLSPGDYDQLHHFIADGVWDAAPLESKLLIQADRLVGGEDAVLVIDDTALPKKGDRSVGVAAQYASSLGKTSLDDGYNVGCGSFATEPAGPTCHLMSALLQKADVSAARPAPFR